VDVGEEGELDLDVVLDCSNDVEVVSSEGISLNSVEAQIPHA